MKSTARFLAATALVQSAATASPAVGPRIATPRENLPAMIDTIVARQLATHHIAGATVAIVQDGKLVFAKGYGYADTAQRTPVVADRTLFRIGSVSKIFTTIAAMQLVEAGKLRLDRDIGRYLDFPIPRVAEHPVTLAHIMTHTAGFAESLDGMLVKAPRDILPLGLLVKRTLPPLVRAPGVAPSYSNHAIALEGYIVERASGEAYADYLDRHVFGPLGMHSTSAREPLPPTLAAHVSQGHLFENGRLVPQPFELINMAPAGSISATATDMALFMIANLKVGPGEDPQILGAAAARSMQACHYRTDPRASCMGYGFYHQRIAGHDVIAHDGGTNLFSSNMVLVPAKRLGVFVSYNSPGGATLLDDLPRAVIEQRLGIRPEPATPAARYSDVVADYAGSYRSTRRIQHGWLTILGLAAGDVEVIGPNRLRFDDRVWQQIGPGWFRDVSPQRRDQTLIFHRDGYGQVDSLYLGNVPPAKFERVAGYTTLGAAQTMLAAFAVASLGFGVWACLARRRLWRSESNSIVVAVGLGITSTLAGAALLIGLSATLESAGYGPPPAARLMIALFDIGALSLTIAGGLALRSRRINRLTLSGKVMTLAVLATALPLTILLAACHLIGFPL